MIPSRLAEGTRFTSQRSCTPDEALRVQRTLQRTTRLDLSFGLTKTDRSRRSIPLPSSMTSLLRQHKKKQAGEILAAGEDYQRNDFVFTDDEGHPLNERSLVSCHFRPALKKAKLPEKLRLYDLRHTCATLLLASGENSKIVSERLGHSTVTLTLDTYSHVLPTMQASAAEKLESAIFGGKASGKA